MKKILGWAAVAVVAFFVIKNPAQAAGIARATGAGVYAFLSGLAGGGQ